MNHDEGHWARLILAYLEGSRFPLPASIMANYGSGLHQPK
jgi:hypothetical protein